MQLIGLGSTRISTDYAQKPALTLDWIEGVCMKRHKLEYLMTQKTIEFNGTEEVK